jgi:predicted Zn-dependent protease
VQARLELATIVANTQNQSDGVGELKKLATEFPNAANVHHELAHQLEKFGDRAGELLSFQRALDLNTADYKEL